MLSNLMIIRLVLQEVLDSFSYLLLDNLFIHKDVLSIYTAKVVSASKLTLADNVSS